MVNQDYIVSSEIVKAESCSKFEFVCTNIHGCEIRGFGEQTKPHFLGNKIPMVLVYNKSYHIPICHGLMEFIDIGPKLSAANVPVLYPNTNHVFRRTLAFASTDRETVYVATAYLDSGETKIRLTKFLSQSGKISDLILTRGSHAKCMRDFAWYGNEIHSAKEYMWYAPFFVPSTYVLVEPYVLLFTAEGSIFKINIEKMKVVG